MTAEIGKSFRYNGGVDAIRYNSYVEAPAKKAEQQLGITRRGFMRATVANAAMAGIGVYSWQNRPITETAAVEAEADLMVPEAEAVEVIQQPLNSEAFDLQTIKYSALYTLDRESILFIDQTGKIMGEPVPFQDYVEQRGTRINNDGVEEPFFYKLTPAALMDNGAYAVEGIPSEWSDYVTKQQAAQLGTNPEALDFLHATADFRAAVRKDDEPALLAGIESGEIRTIVDIVNYFANRPAPGYESQSSLEYINANIAFTGNLATVPVVVAELTRVLPGLCALESKFDNSVTSPDGARTIFQFKPSTWEKELRRPAFQEDVAVGLPEQVEAAGELLSKMYDRLHYWCYEEEPYAGRNFLEEIKTLFSNQEDFEKYFLTPCLINAYNTGEKGMGEVVRVFAGSEALQRLRQQGGRAGFNVFQAMAEFGATSDHPDLDDYGPEASTYVQRAYAFADVL